MKKIIIGLFAAVAMVSCKTDRSDHPHIDPKAATIATVTPLSPINQLILTKPMALANVTFNWSKADYGFQAAVKYVLQADVKGGDFSAPLELAVVNETMAQLTVDKLNELLVNKFKFEPADEDKDAIVYQFDIRVGSYISDYVDKLYSAPSTINVVTYHAKVIIPSLSVPGTQQGWDPKSPDHRVWSVAMNKVYTGWMYMYNPDAEKPIEFKFIDDIAWNNDKTYGGGSGLSGTIEIGGANIDGVPTGHYRIEVDLVKLTYDMTPIATWGLIGSATSGAWDTSTPMTYDSENMIWIAENVVCTDGEFKFRANNAWDINFGSTSTSDEPELIASGMVKPGGKNIKINAGKYTFKMDLKPAFPTFEVIPQ